MKLKRAIWVSVVTYVFSLIIGLVPIAIMATRGVSTSDWSQLSSIVFLILASVSVIMALIFTLVYLRDKSIKRNAKEGFYFGLVLIATGFVLDNLVLLSSSLATNIGFDILYYFTPSYLVAVALVLITTTAVGAIKGKKK